MKQARTIVRYEDRITVIYNENVKLQIAHIRTYKHGCVHRRQRRRGCRGRDPQYLTCRGRPVLTTPNILTLVFYFFPSVELLNTASRCLFFICNAHVYWLDLLSAKASALAHTKEMKNS